MFDTHSPRHAERGTACLTTFERQCLFLLDVDRTVHSEHQTGQRTASQAGFDDTIAHLNDLTTQDAEAIFADDTCTAPESLATASPRCGLTHLDHAASSTMFACLGQHRHQSSHVICVYSGARSSSESCESPMAHSIPASMPAVALGASQPDPDGPYETKKDTSSAAEDGGAQTLYEKDDAARVEPGMCCIALCHDDCTIILVAQGCPGMFMFIALSEATKEC